MIRFSKNINVQETSKRKMQKQSSTENEDCPYR